MIYAIDLGNGFSKRLFDGKNVLVDPSVYAEPLDYFNIKKREKTLSVNDGRTIYIGKDAFDSGYTIKSALGDSDIERYDAPEFKELLFGFVGKDIADDADIELLVLGLPVQHFAKKAGLLKDTAKGKKMVKLHDKEIVLNIKDVVVIPQPLGTYMYMESQGHDTSARALIVDGGYGTLDMTEMKGKEVIGYDGSNLGMKQAFKDIYKVLTKDYDGIDIHINQIPDILDNGLRWAGGVVNVAGDPKICAILDSHFDDVYKRIIDIYDNTKRFDAVIWTGGMALTHKNRIEAKQQKNYKVVEEGQTANVLGYYEFGKGLKAVTAGTTATTTKSKK
jgi:plasmid segregation protein ParM